MNLIADLIDRLALWWLDRRTAPLDIEPTFVRFIGGPLDGETHDVGHTTPVRAAVFVHGDWHAYRPDGTTDTDGAHLMFYDPQEDQ